MIGLIWAQDREGAIGSGTSMLWRVPADMKHFRSLTLGNPVVMGRRTWESLGCKPLPGRDNIVLSQREGFAAPGARVAHSFLSVIQMLRDEDEWWVIGGGQIYQLAIPWADLAAVTTVDLVSGGTVKAPRLGPQWVHISGASDREGIWRERSGDARWRADWWQNRDPLRLN